MNALLDKIWQFSRKIKKTTALGTALFTLAAVFLISLLLVAIDFGGNSAAHNNALYRFGRMLSGAYGISSLFIPAFFLVSALQMIGREWKIKNGVILALSIVPFFTLVAMERLCRHFSATSTGTVLGIELFSTILLGTMMVVGEFILIAIFGDIVQERVSEDGVLNFKNYEKGEKIEEQVRSVYLNDVLEEATEIDDKKKSPWRKRAKDEPVTFVDMAIGDKILDFVRNDVKPVYLDEMLEESTKIDDGEPTLDITAPAIPPASEILSTSYETEDENPFAHIFDNPPATEQIDSENEESANDESEINYENVETESDSENDESENDSENNKTEINSADDEGDLAEAEIAGELVGGIFSLMDDDAAANPVLKDGDNTDERAAADSAIPDREEIEQNEDDEEIERARAERQAAFAEIESAAQKALDEAGKNHEENGARYEFDPTARPVVDSDGNVIEYDDEQESAENEEGDEDFDDLSRAMNHKMNVTDDLDDSDDEDDDENDDAKTDPFRPSTNNSIPESQKFRKGPYSVPTDLLDTYPGNEYWIVDEETRKAGEELKATLSEFKIEAEVTGIRKGPAVTMYELLPAPGVKLSKIVALQDNIALRLAAASIRIVAPIPGKHAVGIEVPNKSRAIVSFKEIIEQNLPAFDKMAIPVVLGKDISGEAQLLDLAKTPHLLIAGSTGAGKSVCVNSMLLSILYKRSPEQVKLVLVDPKIVELKLYNDIPHLLTPVITEPKRALQSLQYCLCEMERRYALLDGMGVRNIISYNKKIVEKHIATEKLPYIVVIIDEFADLMATTGKELETTIARLAAMSRAVGIHLVLATQRPSVDVITGLIKANIPSRIAFMVASKMDSRIIIDQLGADKLLGKGDMLYVGVTDPFPSRIQGTLVGDDEVERVVEFVKTYGEPEYIDEEMFVDEDEDDGGSGESMFDDGSDPLYDQALQIVIQSGKASASYIQRRLKIGYNRAARLVEEMEERGIVGPANGSKPREIIHIPG